MSVSPRTRTGAAFTKILQVSLIYIAQYHKSQFASRGFTICTAYNTPQSLDAQLRWEKKRPPKKPLTGKSLVLVLFLHQSKSSSTVSQQWRQEEKEEKEEDMAHNLWFVNECSARSKTGRFLGLRYCYLQLSREPLIQTTSHSTLPFLGSSAVHPPSVKSIGWTAVEIIEGQLDRDSIYS